MTDTEAITVTVPPTTSEFTCERCGFKYQKLKDWAPFLCHRCLRFLGKGVYKLTNQVIPPVSRPEESRD